MGHTASVSECGCLGSLFIFCGQLRPPSLDPHVTQHPPSYETSGDLFLGAPNKSYPEANQSVVHPCGVVNADGLSWDTFTPKFAKHCQALPPDPNGVP